MAKKYYSRSEKEKLAKKLATVVAVFVIVCTATVVIGHIVDNQKMNSRQKDAAAASDIVRSMVWNVNRTGMCRRIFLLEKMPEV